MEDRFTGLRCQPGDLAVIVQDDPECLANIGQLVRVIKKYDGFPEEWGFHWWVQPLSSQPSPVVIEDVQTRARHVEFDNGPRAHLDAWLRPLRDSTDTDGLPDVQDAEPGCQSATRVTVVLEGDPA